MVIENDKNKTKTKTDAEIDMLIEDMMNAALTNSPITNIPQNQNTNIEKKEVIRRIKNVRKNPPKLSVLNPDDIPNE